MDQPLSSGDFDVYASLAAAEAGVLATGSTVRAVRCQTDGTLRVKKATGGGLVDLPFKAGETQCVQITAIVAASSTGCVPITIYR